MFVPAKFAKGFISTTVYRFRVRVAIGFYFSFSIWIRYSVRYGVRVKD